MDRITRGIVFAMALASTLGALASSAGATTWSNDGDASFTATGTPATYSVTGTSLSCSGADLTGTVNGSSAAAIWTAVTDATLQFTGCFTAGVNTPVHCTTTLTAVAGVTNGVTTGALDVTCGVYQFNTKICDFSGSLNATYTNPTSTTAGRLTTLTGGSMRTGIGCSTFLGGGNDAMHWSPMTFTVVGGATKGPIITHA